MQCSTKQRHCPGGSCIPLADNFKCPDELCPTDWRPCDDVTQCFQESQLCDGIVHCADASDEKESVCINMEESVNDVIIYGMAIGCAFLFFVTIVTITVYCGMRVRRNRFEAKVAELLKDNTDDKQSTKNDYIPYLNGKPVNAMNGRQTVIDCREADIEKKVHEFQNGTLLKTGVPCNSVVVLVLGTPAELQKRALLAKEGSEKGDIPILGPLTPPPPYFPKDADTPTRKMFEEI